jgi:hypothetical protein
MKKLQQKQTSYTSEILDYFKRHKVSLGLLLASYGTLYLSTVFMSGWSIQSWGEDIIAYPPFSINPLFPHNLIAPVFFISSLPSLLIGAVMLCRYCLRGLGVDTVEDRERIGILLTAFGLFYIIVGAWPPTVSTNFPWEWQRQIANNGLIVLWLLYILSITVFFVGSLSVYRCSKIYHQKHPEFALET